MSGGKNGGREWKRVKNGAGGMELPRKGFDGHSAHSPTNRVPCTLTHKQVAVHTHTLTGEKPNKQGAVHRGKLSHNTGCLLSS